MTLTGLDVFSLRDSVVAEYKTFTTSFTTIFADDLRQQVETIYSQDRYWPEPLIQIINRRTVRPVSARSSYLRSLPTYAVCTDQRSDNRRF